MKRSEINPLCGARWAVVAALEPAPLHLNDLKHVIRLENESIQHCKRRLWRTLIELKRLGFVENDGHFYEVTDAGLATLQECRARFPGDRIVAPPDARHADARTDGEVGNAPAAYGADADLSPGNPSKTLRNSKQ
jgi:hypothetical protein